MKNYILLSVAKPDQDTLTNNNVWLNFWSEAAKIPLASPDSRKLADNVWLLARDSDVSSLAAIVTLADRGHLEFTTIFLSADT